jgi:phosphotriesterase-related protein
MPIVAAGGYYRAPYPPEVAQMTEDQIADQLARDANAQRWGAFGEIGTSMEMHPDERMMLRAVSKAHLRTGVPIFTHTPHEGCAKCALEQLDLFESQGVNPRHLCIGHLSDITPDQDPGWTAHKAIAKRGAFVGFDTVGHPLALPNMPDIPEAQKVKMVLSLLEAGYEDQVLLSADFYNARELKANWGNGFSTVLVQFVPKLRYAGVDEKTVSKILVDNPRRFLAFVPKKSS